MKIFLQLIQPYIFPVVQAVLAVLAAAILAFLYKLRRKLEQWIDARTHSGQRELLHRLAAEAYALVEKDLKEENGEAKLKAAVEYVLQHWRLTAIGIDYESIKAAVQKAWAELDAKNRGHQL